MSLIETAKGIKNGIADALDSYPKPIYRLVVNGTDIGTAVQDRLMSMTITDNRGIESDSIEVELSDHDGLVEIPPKGAEIEAWIGWSNTGLVYKGKYLVKERSHSGAPDILSLRAESIDLKSAFKKKKERSFDDKTIADILTTIATEQGLQAKINDELGQIKLAHIDQNESDANLITRIAIEHDAIATVKNGCLLFMPAGGGKTFNGSPFPDTIIVRTDGDSHTFSDTDGADDVSGVTAYYYDSEKAKKQKVTIGMSDENTREIRHIQRDKKTAEYMAQAEYNRIKSNTATFSFKLAIANPELIPEMPLMFLGFKSLIDEIIWLGTKITHRLDASAGFTTEVEAEIYLPDADDLSELITENQMQYTGIVAYYKEGKSTGKVTEGDQTTPKRLTYLYKFKKNAEKAAKREYAELMAEREETPSS